MRYAKWMASLALFSLAACLATPGLARADGIASYRIVDLGNPGTLTDTIYPSIDNAGNLVQFEQRDRDNGIYQTGSVQDTAPGRLNVTLSHYINAAGSTVNLLPPSLQDASQGSPYDLNSSGLVIGQLLYQPYIYSLVTGKFLDVKPLPGQFESSILEKINNSGQIIATNNYPVFYSSPTAVPILLSDLLPANSGWKLITVSDINDLGEIVGWGKNPSGQLGDFELIPTTTPEPNTLIIFGIGVLFYGGWRARSLTLPSQAHDKTIAG